MNQKIKPENPLPDSGHNKNLNKIQNKNRPSDAVLSRLAALDVLNRIESEHITVDIAFERAFKSRDLSKQDKGLANAIVYGVLRNRGNLDWIISSFSSTRIEKIGLSVLNILRTGIFQIKFLDRIPVSAAVNTSVELAKKTGLKPFIHKFINAVLRKAASGAVPDYPHSDDLSYFYARHSLPEWLSSRWLARFGREDTESLCVFINSIPPLSLRTNTLKISRESLIERLAPYSETLRLHEYSECGINLTGFRGAVSDPEEFRNGFFQVQDEAAQLVSVLLDPGSGETVLDACCGLGGKTGHIGQIMKNEGMITASDNDSGKLAALHTEMQRLGIENVKCLVHDFLKPADEQLKGFFDRVLVDAPCSGLGVIRRNPDTRWTKDDRNFFTYAERQLSILENAAETVKIGGRLVYSVCTFEPEETTDVVDRFLEKHRNFVCDDNINDIFKKHPFQMNGSRAGTVTILPHRAGMDGFFAACLKKNYDAI